MGSSNSKKVFRLSSVILVSVFFVLTGFGQQSQDDFNSWSALEFKYKPNKKWDFGIETQFRLKEEASTVDAYFGQIDVSRDLWFGLKLGMGLRYIRENDNQGRVQGYENHVRYQIDLSHKYKIARMVFKSRLRYQNKNELGISNQEGDIPVQRMRLKVGSIYNFRKWKLDPEISGEIFNKFKKATNNNEFDKYRINIGTSYDFKGNGRLSVFYRFENEFNTANQLRYHILFFKYRYMLKSKG
ncbi:DUF2490 domain-containing protein [Snuella sedimenti]|uniref:DUF2490 domain-containing protein n=1 Tax=Snuella sedimenti TaxID=2798802 RepID=A0A8J7LRR3_9FLAO|nr:DUF2490 domain-containing protein [Snuella sedimenti]MBJ6367485.1 DUF2490 domain-containing protein [Snuella sedimenti]